MNNLFGDIPTNLHPSPVDDAVIAVDRESVIFEDSLEDERDVEFHVGYFASALT